MNRDFLKEDSLLLVLACGETHHYHPGDQVSGDVYLNLTQSLQVTDIELKAWGREVSFWRRQSQRNEPDKRKRLLAEEDQVACDMNFHGRYRIFKFVYGLFSQKVLLHVGDEKSELATGASGQPADYTATAASPPASAVLASTEQKGRTLHAGQHAWRFTFVLPANLPGTFHLTERLVKADTRYKIKASLVIPDELVQRKPPTPFSQEIFVVEHVSLHLPPASKTAHVELVQSCAANPEVDLTISLANGKSSCLVTGEDVLIDIEAPRASLGKIRQLTIQLRQTISLKSSSRRMKVFSRIQDSRVNYFEKDVKQTDLVEAEDSTKKIKTSSFIHIPSSISPTSIGTLIKSQWELCLLTDFDSRAGPLRPKRSLSTALGITILPAERLTRNRQAPYGFKTSGPNALSIIRLQNGPCPDPAKVPPPFFSESLTPDPKPAPYQGPLVGSAAEATQWIKLPSTNEKYRWVEPGEIDYFPPELWGDEPEWREERDGVPRMSAERDFGAQTFDYQTKKSKGLALGFGNSFRKQTSFTRLASKKNEQRKEAEKVHQNSNTLGISP